MRPRRAAAVAANAAISAQSKQTDGTVEEHHTEDANDGVDAEPEQESLLSFKVQKNAQTASVTANNKKRKVKPEEEEVAAQSQKTEDANGTFIFHKLPSELKRIILSHFDDDPYIILSLTLVSKTFLSSLGTHSDPDKDWERRCRLLGAKKKSPGSKTWRETYLRIVTKKCAMCHKNTTAKLGKLFKTGPTCIVVCEPCQQFPGPYRVISTRALGYLPSIEISKKDLAELNWKRRCINEHLWLKEHLFDEVLPIYAGKLRKELQEADEEFSEEELLSRSQRDLEQAIMACNVDIIQTRYEHQMMTGFLNFL